MIENPVKLSSGWTFRFISSTIFSVSCNVRESIDSDFPSILLNFGWETFVVCANCLLPLQFYGSDVQSKKIVYVCVHPIRSIFEIIGILLGVTKEVR